MYRLGQHGHGKTGEEQLLLLTAPTLRQRRMLSLCSEVPGLDRYALREVVDVAQAVSPETVVDGSQSCAANVSSTAPMAAPHQDAMPHIRFRLVARQDGEQPQTVTHHTKGVLMRHGTDHIANKVDICSKPFKRARARVYT